MVQVDEAETAQGGVAIRGGMATRLEQAEQTFDGALATIRLVADGVVTQLAGMAHSPEEVHVEFGLELSAKVGTVLVTGGSAAHLTVQLTWRPRHPEHAGGGGPE
jgi:hypothetical protein